MNVEKIEKEGQVIASVTGDEPVIADVQTALDFIMSVNYETGSRRIALNKAAVSEDFFILSTRLAGDVLQKFVNYHIKFAVYGDFSAYTSGPLKDFMYESNKGESVFFAATLQEAIDRLAAAKE